MVLNDTDRELIAAIQQGLPLVSRPYASVGAQLGLSETEVIARLAELQDAGMIKRMGVVVRHRALGYRANAMVVWDIPEHRVHSVGEAIARAPFVTLCYQRPRRRPHWPYNLFCMIHGVDRQRVLSQLDGLIVDQHLQAFDHEVLFSTKAYRQRGARYVSND